MNWNSIRILSFLAIATLFSSCNKGAVYADSVEIDGPWSYRKPLEFNVSVPDTINQYSLFFDIRITSDYAYSNLWLFVESTSGNLSQIDTIDCPIAYPDGRWMGSGLGDLIDNKILIKKKFRFSKMGNFKIKIKHGMRNNNLENIRNIGVLVEQYQGK